MGSGREPGERERPGEGMGKWKVESLFPASPLSEVSQAECLLSIQPRAPSRNEEAKEDGTGIARRLQESLYGPAPG